MNRSWASLGLKVDSHSASLVATLLIAAAPLLAAEDSTIRIMDEYGRLPLRFERNEGQAGGPVRYLSRGPGYTMSVTPTEMVLSLREGNEQRGEAPLPRSGARGRVAVLRVKLLGGRGEAEVEGLKELPGKAHYLVGNDPKRWRPNVAAFEKVRCRDVYPGIDLVYYGRQKELEYDFVVAPGGDPRSIRLGFEGARSLRLDGKGNLIVALGGGEVTKSAPQVYQEVGSKRETVSGRWVLRGKKEAGFEAGAYDRRQALVSSTRS